MRIAIAIVAHTLFRICSAQIAHSLVGTWSSKSKSVITGPGFFNPLTESLLEPNHTGVSYSFTADGFYESALYSISSNPAQPECPTGVLQWAHGSYTLTPAGGIDMVPIAVDGRQLLSQPCLSEKSTYIRFSTNDTMQSYSIAIDPYHGEWRLTLNRLYGSPVQPLYLVYDPPQMLPTTTLLPTSTSTAKTLNKRGVLPIDHNSQVSMLNHAWYGAVGLIVLGAIGYVST